MRTYRPYPDHMDYHSFLNIFTDLAHVCDLNGRFCL